jgi:hypothetical protein
MNKLGVSQIILHAVIITLTILGIIPTLRTGSYPTSCDLMHEY